ncbi:aromatic ring-hydroxylating oxygenase subunit alpha [Planctomycetaceae bacterium SH139]
MFQSDTHKPQLLPSDAYSDPARFAAEWEQLFAPAWHCVATLSDFPRDGDYRTLTLGRYPLILRREAGTVHAYLNVCPHRFSLLRHDPCGNLPKLQCQYHGWEFSACGNTQRIPDAKSFKPLKKGMLGLTTYQTQTCGDLIFVNLHPEPTPLAEVLGENGKLIEAWFSPAWRPMMTYDVSVAANWKAYLENGIESYHIEAVHSKTLVQSPVEDLCEHELGDGYTIFRSRQPDPRATVRAIDRWHHRLLQVTPEPYTHCHLYPHLTFIRMSVFSYLEAVIPVGPTESRIVTRGYVYRGREANWFRRATSRLAGHLGSRFLKEIQDEDCDILNACQQGLSAVEHPRGGLISTREERIFHFQQYVQAALKSKH